MGWLYQTPEVEAGTDVAPLATRSPLGAAGLAVAALNRAQGRASEAFNVRQPDHVVLAGALGLGVFDRDQIEHRTVELI